MQPHSHGEAPYSGVGRAGARDRAETGSLVERGGQALGCHAFLQEITVRGPALPRAKLSRLRLECGEEVQAEQREREERSKEDGSTITHG